MKLNKYINSLLLIIGFVSISLGQVHAQDKNEAKNDKRAAIQKLINSRDFVFVARSATPMGGRFINLTSLYDLRVAGDSVLSDLPYFGRAFVAPVNPTESALRFTSTQFDYKVKERKKGGWDITIVPKDGKDVRQMQMTVSEDGYASLQVTSNNRQPISFNGEIRESGKR